MLPTQKRTSQRSPTGLRNVRRHRRLLAETLERRWLLAGPYAPAADEVGSAAISKDDARLVGWASEVVGYSPGSNLDAEFQTPQQSLGPAEGEFDKVVSLGRGGQITLAFDEPIRNGLGADFAVFENAFNDTFLELAFVEVSSDGTHFFRFPNDSLTPSPVEQFGAVDPTEVDQLAGKYRLGFGTPFDLEQLVSAGPQLDLTRVTQVRLVDIVGDGSLTDSSGDPIYDPFPTVGSAGFDLDAVGVIHAAESVVEIIGFEDVGAGLQTESAFAGPVPDGSVVEGPFNDDVVVGTFASGPLVFDNAHSLDFGSWTGWAYSNRTDTQTAGFSNQFSAFPGVGASDSATFGIAFPDQGDFVGPASITRPADSGWFQSLQVANTTYAALSMLQGDQFAKQFGGPTGNDPDFFLLTITGKDDGDNEIGTIDFYLADYRFPDNSQDYVLDRWETIDLTPVGAATTLEFTLSSSDVGPFGINTPAYVAVDQIVLSKPTLAVDVSKSRVNEADGTAAATVRVSRADNDVSSEIELAIAPVDPGLATIPSTASIPVGERFVEFDIDLADNAVFDGPRQVIVTVSADGFEPSTVTVAVDDDEQRSLELAIRPTSISEGGSVTATVGRNDADLSSPLTIQIASSQASLLSFPPTVTIAAGQAETVFTVGAIDDDVDRTDKQVTIEVSADGYVDAASPIEIRDNDDAELEIQVAARLSESQAYPAADLEEVGRGLAPESFYNGADQAGVFASGGLSFHNQFDATFGSWSGWAYSNTTDVSTPGFGNQYSAFPGSGAYGSDTYAVAAAFPGPTPPVIRRDPTASGAFQSLEISNTTYAALSMQTGDAFAKKFGGETGDDPDFFLLTIEGVDDQNQSTGTVDFYLADFRFADNSLDYLVDQWTTVDVTPLGDAVELRFGLSSSDVGAFGMNTPAYFAVDDVITLGTGSLPQAIVRRNAEDLARELTVTLTSSDPSEIVLPPTVTIPTGAAEVTVMLAVRDDQLVELDPLVVLTASADGYTAAVAGVTVSDDDEPTLTLTLDRMSVAESGDDFTGVVHRNVADVSQPLTVDLEASPLSELTLPGQVLIPAGSRAASFSLQPVDNQEVDDHRSVNVRSTAPGFVGGADSVQVINDDLPPPTLSLTLDPTTVSEADAPATESFESLGATILDDSFDNGSDLSGGFETDLAQLNNSFDPTFASWSGWAISKTTDTTTPGFENQYSAVPGIGGRSSPTYAVANAFPGGNLPRITLPTGGTREFDSLMITNTTYAALSMQQGDAFAKQFGGPSGDDPDFFLLTIEGHDEGGQSVGTVEFFLADFRDADSANDFIVDEWVKVDVSSLSAAASLSFSLSSSDVGAFGMNTPAYFALDEIVFREPGVTTDRLVTLTRSDEVLDEPLTVDLATDDPSELEVPTEVQIPAGLASVTFPIQVVDDAVVDGDVAVELFASASSHASATLSVTVADDDQKRLTLSAVTATLVEGNSATTEFLIHRNSADLTTNLEVALSSSGEGLLLPASVVISAGQRAATIEVAPQDNVLLDGDRDLTVRASADEFTLGQLQVHLQDDEVAAITVTETADSTDVTELSGVDQFQVQLSAQPLQPVVIEVVAASADVSLDPVRLLFTPEQWDAPQAVNVTGVPDFEVEDDESIGVTLAVDADASDPGFAGASPQLVDVNVFDHPVQAFSLTEDESGVFAIENPSGVPIVSGTHQSGLQVTANALAQIVELESVTRTRGPITLDLAGGDDRVVVRSERFTAIEGGPGDDVLELAMSSVDLIDFFDGAHLRLRGSCHEWRRRCGAAGRRHSA